MQYLVGKKLHHVVFFCKQGLVILETTVNFSTITQVLGFKNSSQTVPYKTRKVRSKTPLTPHRNPALCQLNISVIIRSNEYLIGEMVAVPKPKIALFTDYIRNRKVKCDVIGT